MGALAMFENLPLGFRFKPTDVELIDHYLRLKVNGKDNEVSCIKEVDICRVEPWDLPDLSAIRTNDHEWFFFCPRDRKYPNGQRSNRATGAGYWKATGKDRTIKSRKMGLIGMKKTLVFYTGRAPKGQRTNWVIHEYRTTLQEIDGTNPGQGAFVLCRLFKKADDLKQDDNDDGSNTDEVETNVLSPHLTNISQEDMRSEQAVVQASPVSVEQSVEQQTISENCVVKTSDSITSETVMPDRSHSYSYGHTRQEFQVNGEMAHEVDSHMNDAMDFRAAREADSHFNGAMKYGHHDPLKPHPLHPMTGNLGNLDVESFFNTDIGDGYTGLQLQEINGRSPISDFLDSVLINPDDPLCKETGTQGPAFIESEMWKMPDAGDWKKASVNESGSCSGSDVEVAQLQHDSGLIGCITYSNGLKGNEQPLQNCGYSDDDDIFSDAALDRFCNLPNVGEHYIASGQATLPNSFLKAERGYQNVVSTIKIRPNPRKEQGPLNYVQQGSAPRRIRLLVGSETPVCKAAEEAEESIVTEESCLSAQGNISDMNSSIIALHEDGICLDEVSENPAAAGDRDSSRTNGEVVEAGIKIRARRQRSQESSTSCVEQGTASRRIRLQVRPAFRSCDDEDDNAKPLVDEISKIPEVAVEKSCADESNQKPTSYMRSTSVLSKGSGWRSGSLVQMIKVVMGVFLFVACIGLWRARNVILVSS